MDTVRNEERNRATNRVSLNDFHTLNFTDEDEFVSRLDARRIDVARKEEDKEADRASFFVRRGRTILEGQLMCCDEESLWGMSSRNNSASHLGHTSFEVRIDFRTKKAYLHGGIDIADCVGRKEWLRTGGEKEERIHVRQCVRAVREFQSWDHRPRYLRAIHWMVRADMKTP